MTSPTDIFATLPLFDSMMNSNERIIINQGGTSSGKTYTILQLLVYYALSFVNKVITVVGQDIPNLKKGAYRDVKTIIGNSDFCSDKFSFNESDRIVKCVTGSIIEFVSFQNEQDAKSGKRDYLFVNEANGIPYPVYWQLAIRTRKQIFIDYNPTARFWVHDKIIGKPEAKLFITDHRHNTFLSEEEHDKIEGIEDKELHRVYARGKTGRLRGMVYDNYDIVDSMPDNYKGRWLGLDFGYNDPTALVDVRLSGGDLWIDEILFEGKVTNPDISRVVRQNGMASITIIADSAEPKSIEELKRFGLRIEGAKKGNDSIRLGISVLKRYKWHVTRRSTNIRKELANYKWEEGDDGEPTNEPIELFNHSLDAIRYVALNRLFTPSQHKKIFKLGNI